ncbi:MAG: Crp/Fnr family transcriptional regulator [Bacilli bacterium]|nr:Crp/Fnr family transcriptional regulator [Bacilli bacterium]
MDIENIIKVWEKIDLKHQNMIKKALTIKIYKANDIIYQSGFECLGLTIIKKGTLRAYMNSYNGKEITLYKLSDNDICLFSNSCSIKDLTLNINIMTITDTEVYIIPTNIYNILMGESNEFANYINNILTNRFKEAMWTFEQTIFYNLESRIATYLLEQNKNVINITHEKIANELGSSREVISRILKKMETNNIIKLDRNNITILNKNKLQDLIQ